MSDKEKKDNTEQEVRPEPSVNEMVEDAKELVIEEFYKDIIRKADETIRSHSKQIADLTKQQVRFRDEVALECYTTLIQVNSDYPQAAGDAFRAADAFLRFRENESEVNEKQDDHAESN